ncbi:MAG: PKD domain-containing protein [Patescibacteria group bacterium]
MKADSKEKNTVSPSMFTTTFLLAVIILFLFNFNFEVFNIGAASGPIRGEGQPGFIPKWVAPPLPPVLSAVTVTEPNYCVSGPAATIGWTYSDPSGSPQSAYQVQIDDQGSFNSPEWDSCLGGPPNGTCASGNTSTLNSTPQGILQFNKTYRARVKAWNQYDVSSDWIVSSIWRTPNHAYPQVNFFFARVAGQQQLIPNDPIQFTDQTVFYDGKGDQNHSWSWFFGDGGSSTQKNPVKSYSQSNTYNVTLTATDNTNQSCSISKPVNVEKSNPIWKEVNPGG